MLTFISKHKGLLRFISIIIFVISFFVFTKSFDNNQAIGIALSFVFLIIFNFFLGIVDSYLVFKAIERLDVACDYKELYELSARLLKEKNHPKLKQIYSINYALCLIEMGKFDEALNVHLSMDIADYTPVNVRYVYYHNLAEIYNQLNNKDEAEKCYSIEKSIFENLLNEKSKDNSINTYLAAESDHCYRIGEFEKALSFMQNIKPNNLRQQLGVSYSLGRIYIKLNDYDAAKKHLDFVIKNGNMLYVVKFAKEILKDIEN